MTVPKKLPHQTAADSQGRCSMCKRHCGEASHENLIASLPAVDRRSEAICYNFTHGLLSRTQSIFLNYPMRTSHVYILTNKNHTVLYVGVTSNLVKRIGQHKSKFYKGFTSRYNCDQLMYYRVFDDIRDAITYEKKLKAGNRANKEKLINLMNPEWKDLAEEWEY